MQFGRLMSSFLLTKLAPLQFSRGLAGSSSPPLHINHLIAYSRGSFNEKSTGGGLVIRDGSCRFIRASSFKFRTLPDWDPIALKNGFSYEFIALKNHLDFIMPRFTFDRITICTNCNSLFKSLYTGESKYPMNQDITDYLLDLLKPFSGDVVGNQGPLAMELAKDGRKNTFEDWKADQLVHFVSSFNSLNFGCSKYAQYVEKDEIELQKFLATETKFLVKKK